VTRLKGALGGFERLRGIGENCILISDKISDLELNSKASGYCLLQLGCDLMAETTQTYLLADGSAELERLTLQARVWEPEREAIAERNHLPSEAESTPEMLEQRTAL